MSNSYYDNATFPLKNNSLHVNISFPVNTTQKKVFNFNVTDTVLIKYLLVCKCTHDNKILKFGADKIYRDL